MPYPNVIEIMLLSLRNIWELEEEKFGLLHFIIIIIFNLMEQIYIKLMSLDNKNIMSQKYGQ